MSATSGDERSLSNEKAREMRECFALLLSKHSVLAATRSPAHATHTARIRALLKQFGERRDRAEASEQAQATDDRKRIGALLVGYDATAERYRRQQEQDADDFNLLDVLRLTGKEIRHSMMLAWLLDRDMRKLGTHAQGALGFGYSSASSASPSTTPTAPTGSGGRWSAMNRSSMWRLRAGADSSFTSRTRFGLVKAAIKRIANGRICSAERRN